MAVRQKKTQGRSRRWRRLKIAAPIALLFWAALSHFVVRPRAERVLAELFRGEATARFAILWPTLNVTAFGVRIRGEEFSVAADRVAVDLNLLAVFGTDLVLGVEVSGLHAELAAGEPVEVVRGRAADDPSSKDSEGVGKEGGGGSLDPLRLPPLLFHDALVSLREPSEEPTRVLRFDRLEVVQEAPRVFSIDAGGGALGRVPFTALSARVLPRAGHVLLSDLRLLAFRGVFGGVLDLDLTRAGAFNGELEWHLVDVASVWQTYGLPYSEKRRGALSGRLTFQGTRPAARAIAGAGTLALSRARFFSPLSFRVLGVLKVPVEAESMIHKADIAFSFERGLVYVESARLRAQTYLLEGLGLIGFGGGADLEISHAGTTVSVSGTLADPRIKVLPLNGLTAPFDRLFRERVR